MVPAAGLIIGMSSLVARNVVRTRSPQGQTVVNRASVVVLTGLALVLAIVRPDLLANLLLLTYSGLDQLVPALVLALFAHPGRAERRGWTSWAGLRPVLAGLVVGEVVVIALTFGPYAGTVNEGLIALVPNILVVAVGALHRAAARRRCADGVRGAGPGRLGRGTRGRRPVLPDGHGSERTNDDAAAPARRRGARRDRGAGRARRRRRRRRDRDDPRRRAGAGRRRRRRLHGRDRHAGVRRRARARHQLRGRPALAGDDAVLLPVLRGRAEPHGHPAGGGHDGARRRRRRRRGAAGGGRRARRGPADAHRGDDPRPDRRALRRLDALGALRPALAPAPGASRRGRRRRRRGPPRGPRGAARGRRRREDLHDGRGALPGRRPGALAVLPGGDRGRRRGGGRAGSRGDGARPGRCAASRTPSGPGSAPSSTASSSTTRRSS